jgi:hypothetical protein
MGSEDRKGAAERVAVQLPRARPKKCVKNRTISRAKRSAATACSARWSLCFGLPPACADHTGTLPRRHNGRSVAITPSTPSRPARRAFGRHQVQHTITLPWPGTPHNGPSYHAGITGALHNGPSYYAMHNGPWNAGERHNARSRIATNSYDKNGLPTTLPQRPNGLPISRRKRTARRVKSQRSRARSGRLHGRVRRSGRCRSRSSSMCRPHPHIITPCITGLDQNHAQHTITPCITGLDQNQA